MRRTPRVVSIKIFSAKSEHGLSLLVLAMRSTGIRYQFRRTRRAKRATSGRLTRDSDIRKMNRELSDDLLSYVCQPDFPLPPRSLSHSLDHESSYDDQSHDSLE